MPKYLFTSDLRISELPARITSVATRIAQGGSISDIVDKSENNNAATLKFYFNLQPDTEVCSEASKDALFAIRNYVLKFQFPNVRTPESLKDSIEEKTLFAPYRKTVSLLLRMAETNEQGDSFLSISEILYFLFCDSSVYQNPLKDNDTIIREIYKSREQGWSLEERISKVLEWKQYARQSREFYTILTYASKCFKLKNNVLSFSLNSEEYLHDKEYIDQIICFNQIWLPSDSNNFELSTLEYINYMDTAKTPYNVIDFNNAPGSQEQSIDYTSKGMDSMFVNALRTKPFLLLAGISGTGKSQKVQELAFMTCPKELREENSTTPGNYCLIEVKPNWHDSTELLGYYSTLSGKYELTKFVRFVYKAIQNQDTPFFVCLDEMNLAPVEQYFAEYLSVLETRKRVFNEEAAIYEILTAPLLDREVFASCCLKKTVEVPKPNSYVLDSHIYTKEVDLYEDKKDEAIITFLKKYGLYIPENLFVIGTVNMDDTTHQFSRKVIDRAFTIEMNGGKMEEMFSPKSKLALEYRDEPVKLEEFKSEFVKAYEVLEDSRFAKYQSVIATKVPELLGDSDGHAAEGSLNGILNKTPFRVSYRVQNELVLYLSTLIERAGFPDNIDSLIGEAFLAILLEKVLPRIQGEAKQLETKDGKSNILKDMMDFVEKKFPKTNSVEQKTEGTDDTDIFDSITESADKEDKPAPSTNLYDQVMTKLDEMDKKLTGYYTNFF